jgi:hypothetical protein
MLLELGFAPFVSIVEGAVDCMVVRVVVRERSDGAGDENVLPPPAVTPVRPSDDPALDDLVVVSGLVERVGAADLLLKGGALWLSADGGGDSLPPTEERLPVRPDGGAETKWCTFLWPPGWTHEPGYGLLRTLAFLDLEAY